MTDCYLCRQREGTNPETLLNLDVQVLICDRCERKITINHRFGKRGYDRFAEYS